MPKIVDHEQRRRELAGAVWRVIAAGGPQAVTIRDVAAEAGRSAGSLRHYFPTKESLLVFALRLAAERATARLHERGAEPDLAVLLETFLPLDAERRDEARIWFALVGQAAPYPAVAAELEQAYTRISDWLTALLPAALPRRRTAAAVLFAGVDGIAVRALADPAGMPPSRQRAALRLHMDALLGS